MSAPPSTDPLRLRFEEIARFRPWALLAPCTEHDVTDPAPVSPPTVCPGAPTYSRLGSANPSSSCKAADTAAPNRAPAWAAPGTPFTPGAYRDRRVKPVPFQVKT